MTITCPIVSVTLLPANVSVVGVTVRTVRYFIPVSIIETCTAPCTLFDVIVQWQNTGGVDSTFVPLIDMVNLTTGITLSLPPSITGSTITVPANGITTVTFNPPSLPLQAGRYLFNPNNNPTLTGKTITIVDPLVANITAISITPSLLTCETICGLTVEVTWENKGNASGIFTPGLQVGTELPIMLTSVTLGSFKRFVHTFLVTGLDVGNWTICPIPN